MMFSCSVDLFWRIVLFLWVWIITMIESFSYSVYGAVGIDVSSTVIGYFKYCTRIMMSSGFCNYWSTYCFIFSLYFFYWSLASLFLDMVPKTALKSSTSPLKFKMDGVYDRQLKCLPHPPRPLQLPLPPKHPQPRPLPPLLELYLIVVSRHHSIVASLSPWLLPTAGEVVSVYRVITFIFSTMLN